MQAARRARSWTAWRARPPTGARWSARLPPTGRRGSSSCAWSSCSSMCGARTPRTRRRPDRRRAAARCAPPAACAACGAEQRAPASFARRRPPLQFAMAGGWRQCCFEAVPCYHSAGRPELAVGAMSQLQSQSACCACTLLSEHIAPGRAPGAAAVSALRSRRVARDAALPLCVRPRALWLGACAAAAAGPLARRGGLACAARSGPPRKPPSYDRGGRTTRAALPADYESHWRQWMRTDFQDRLHRTVPQLTDVAQHACVPLPCCADDLARTCMCTPMHPQCAQLHSQAELAAGPAPLSRAHNK